MKKELEEKKAELEGKLQKQSVYIQNLKKALDEATVRVISLQGGLETIGQLLSTEKVEEDDKASCNQ